MILVTAATEFEIKPVQTSRGKGSFSTLVCGVGPVESSLNLTRYLDKSRRKLRAVINFGVAGAYVGERMSLRPKLLDTCIAETEVLGDLGVCFPLRIDDLPAEVCRNEPMILDMKMQKAAALVFRDHDISPCCGNFVTVSGVSGTLIRGEILRQKFSGICENMEGAALARVCREFDLPFFELRCISNYVEDRNPASWKLRQASEKAGRMVALLLENIGKYYEYD